MSSFSSVSWAGAVPEQVSIPTTDGAVVEALPGEHAGLDRGPGAGERQEGHGEVRLLDGERERGAHLIAVKRAMAGGTHPARAVARPVCCRGSGLPVRSRKSGRR